MLRGTALAAALVFAAAPALGGGITLNEIRIDQTSSDTDEYVELLGPPGANLSDVWIIVLGDGAGGSGIVETAVDLTGSFIPADGHFLVAEDNDTFGAPADLIPLGTNPLNFENSDNVTFLLVDAFTGMVGNALDANSDGIIDAPEPWAEIIDCVALIETPGAGDLTYCVVEVGPDGTFVPGHVFFCVGAEAEWQIGAFEPVGGNDTPGTANPECDVVPQTDVAVFKDGPAVAVDGATVVYTITVSNFGQDPADTITITDTLPAGVTFVAESSPLDVMLVDSTEPTIGWTLATLEALGERVIELEVTLGPGLGGSVITNSVDVTTTSPDDPANNNDMHDTTVQDTIVNLPAVVINEIRTDMPGADTDDFFELRGSAGTSLSGLAYLVIGDGAAALGSGVIDTVIPLLGESIPGDDHFLAVEDTFTLGPLLAADLVLPAGGLGFEGSDNVTHVLVANFTGGPGDDLDADDDGVIDSPAPWSAVIDAVGLLEEAGPPVATELAYGTALGFEDIGPDGNFVPALAYRCEPSGSWAIGPFDFDADDDTVPDGEDTPGQLNFACTVALAVQKSGAVAATPGATIVYTIEVSNLGRDALPNVSIVDTLPAGVLFVSETSGLDVMFTDMTPPTLGWSIASLAPGVTETIQVQVTVKALGGTLVNTVDVSTTAGGDDPADNSDSVTTTVSGVADPPEDLLISEVRASQPGADTDEYFELAGDSGTSLEGVSYIVLGDGAAAQGSGVIECVVPLAGLAVQADGLFLAVEDTYTLTGTADLVLTDDPLEFDDALNFEGSDNVTHLLVANFTGGPGDDLDTDDDGVIDVVPWSVIIDAIGLIEEPNPPAATEYVYGVALGFADVGPDGIFVPGHVYRCLPALTWNVGTFDPLDAASADTPDATNPACPGGTCLGDTNGDGDVDVNDLNNVILDWGTDGSVNGGDITDATGTGPPDGIVNVNDLNAVIVNWGLCP